MVAIQWQVPVSSGGNFEPAPAGPQVGVCYRLIDLGTTYSERWQKSQHNILIGWELAETMDNGEPFIVQKRYSLSMHEKASLRRDIEAWYGKPFASDVQASTFNLPEILGKAALLNVRHDDRDDRTYANVAGIMPLPKGTTAPELKAAPELLMLSEAGWSESVWTSLSDRLKDRIRESDEYQALFDDGSTRAPTAAPPLPSESESDGEAEVAGIAH